MDSEQPRLVLAFSALGGAAVWGTFTVVTALWAGQPVTRQDLYKVLANVVAGILVGMVVAYFLGPVIASYLPLQFKDPHVVGFLTGSCAWEAFPFVMRLGRGLLDRYVKERTS
jgi:MFS family permease